MKKVLSIRGIIVLIFVIAMIVAVFIVLTVVFVNWSLSARNTMKSQAYDLHHTICDKIEQVLDISIMTIEVNSRHFENQLIDIQDEDALYYFFVSNLKSLDKNIYSFSIGTPDGEYYGARRNENDVIEIMRNNKETNGESWYYSINDDLTIGRLTGKFGKFDVRTRDWYQKAQTTRSVVFSDLYYHFVRPAFTVSVSKSILTKNGDFLGVLGVHIVLSDLDNFLTETVKGKKGYAFIAERNTGLLVANSLGLENYVEMDGERIRRNIYDIGNNVFDEAYDKFNKTGISQFKYKGMYFNFVHSESGMDWILCTAVPESYLMKDVRINIALTSVLVILFLISSIIIYYGITNKLVRPVNHLIESTEKFARGDLSTRVDVSRNDELGKITRAFNEMAETIDSLVNDLEKKVKERTSALEDLNIQIKEKEEQLRIILDSAAECIFGVDVNGVCVFCNKSCIQVMGYDSEEELLGQDVHELVHGYDMQGNKVKRSDCKVVKSIIDGIGYFSDDETFVRKDGTQINVSYYSYPQFKDGKIIGAVVTFVDITSRKEEERRIMYLSNHDSLTGFVNKRYFEQLLDEYDNRENLPLAIIYADLNGLKLTNDIFGHDAGDELIVKAANCIRKNVKEDSVTARVGGDEFIVLMPNTDEDAVKEIIDSINKDVSDEYVHAVRCTIAMGYSIKNSRFQDIRLILTNAESEMYKNKGRMSGKFSREAISSFMKLLHERAEREKIHSRRVSLLCEEMAKALGFERPDVRKLKEIGYLHDIGKIGVDKNLLTKSTLTEDEMQTMQQHSFIGYRILNLFEYTVDYADSVLSHHEKWDGSGYPKGLKGEEIPIISRIVAIAEAFDRMLDKMSFEEIIREIEFESGRYFDPGLVPVFLEVVKKTNFK
jgi:diguanylate cyclase (GGDEF)-like protein/PAS domain S-box-containing protein/putative nucleotidyltransferase with HDIG domain